MRILFVLPYDGMYRYRGNFTRSISYAPLTLSTLAALVPPEWEAEIVLVDEGVQKPVERGSFDIVAITCVASNANRAYQLCGFWRGKGSYVILGGVHPTLMPDEAVQHADSLFVGFAEETLTQFFQDFADGAPRKVYRAEPREGYLSMPVPRRDLLGRGYMKIPTVIANRGCGNGCAFCSIPKLWGKCGFARPVGEVIDEIRQSGRKRYILLDPSLSSNRDYALELFGALEPLKIRWSGLATLDIAEDGGLFSAMIRSGCEGILAGFESLNEENLVQMGKRTNKTAAYKQAVETFHRAGIPILGCFVLGFDQDTLLSLGDMADQIDDIGIDLPRFSILTPFPGTALFDDYERQGRILTRDWDLYDTMHVVFQPARMSAEELQRSFYEVWRKTCEVKRIVKRLGNTSGNKLIKLAANLGFKYYAGKLEGAGGVR